MTSPANICRPTSAGSLSGALAVLCGDGIQVCCDCVFDTGQEVDVFSPGRRCLAAFDGGFEGEFHHQRRPAYNNAGGTPRPRKDTAIVKPMESVAVDLVADNPGSWTLHCHNGYQQKFGMMTRLDYVN
ncbi:multicopper oxidase domain-containing protein [Rhodococcus sp. IEGM 1318]|nr:multicopper oxidase domain-containing protein [Rhodococcus sp. IEGM 1318]MDV8009153.1 multicopper oxidase domain-containing protein [Rhodococcus sp. IEGM 1318]